MFDKTTLQGSQYQSLRKAYEAGRERMKSGYDYYNLIEKCILEVTLTDEEQK